MSCFQLLMVITKLLWTVIYRPFLGKCTGTELLGQREAPLMLSLRSSHSYQPVHTPPSHPTSLFTLPPAIPPATPDSSSCSTSKPTHGEFQLCWWVCRYTSLWFHLQGMKSMSFNFQPFPLSIEHRQYNIRRDHWVRFWTPEFYHQLCH